MKLCVFLADDFLQKTGKLPKERAKLHHLQGVLGNFQRPGNRTFVVDHTLIMRNDLKTWPAFFFAPRCNGKSWCAYFDIDRYPENDPCKDIQGRIHSQFPPCQEKGVMLGKAKNHFIFSIESVVRFLSGAPTVFWEDGGKGYSDGKASEKM